MLKEHEEKAVPQEEIEELIEEQEDALEEEPSFDHFKASEKEERVTPVVVEEKHTPESTSQTAVVSAVSVPLNSGVVIAQGGGAARRGGAKRGAMSRKGKRVAVRRRGR
jgi:hypothetical protein